MLVNTCKTTLKMHAGAKESGKRGARGSGDQQASSLTIENESCKSNHKVQHKNFATLRL